MGNRTFAAADYAVFCTTLFISGMIGIYFAIRDRRASNTTERYLMANRSLSMFPVSLSITVSFMSAIAVLGMPSEIYLYGTMFWWCVVVFFVVAVITSQIFIPTFYRLGVASTYEYLEKRFNRPVRILGTLAYIVQSLLYMGIVIYAPALALNEVTKLNLWFSILSTGLICTFYTTLGGLKAVIWTDVFQGFVMCAGFVAVLIKGSALLGGFENVWRICEEGGRIDFLQFETDIRIRHTFWSVVVGGTIVWLNLYAVNQSQVQRYLCCKTEKQAIGALFLNVFGLVIVVSLACLNGLVMYAYYSECDPLTQGCVNKSDQLLPYLVMEILSDAPGVPGLFVSCVYSGSLSTVSTGINAMATVTIEDFIKPVTKWEESVYTWTSKGLVVIYGLSCIGIAVLASFLGEVLQAVISVSSIVGGPLLGMFTMGILIPFCNSIGAGIGMISGLAMSSWIFAGSKAYPPSNEFIRKLSLATCNVSCYFESPAENVTVSAFTSTAESASYAVTESLTTSRSQEYPAISNLYSVSYSYLGCIGCLVAVITGVISSLLTCGWRQRKNVDPALMAPFFGHFLFCWIPGKLRYYLGCCMSNRNENYDFKEGSEMEIHENRNAIPMSTSDSAENACYRQDDGLNKHSVSG